jgi:NAD(P)-dependent dehydrogenase (short-subunit alcohol dehydrogenase family)
MSRRTAFVTGASQGIGATTAEFLARAGYDVAVSSTQPAKLEGLLAKLKAAGARAVPVALDVRSQQSIEQAMAEVIAAFGHLDVLVNNAAVPLRKLALDVTPAEWDSVIGTGLAGTFFMCQQMGRHLVAGKRPGCIISIGSTHGLVAARERSIYGIAKAGVGHMTRMLAYEWAEHGVRVNAVAPGEYAFACRLPRGAGIPGGSPRAGAAKALCHQRGSGSGGLLPRQPGGRLHHRPDAGARWRPYFLLNCVIRDW